MATIYNRDDFRLELEFTRIYREHAGEHKAVREAECLKWQLPRILLDIEEDDLVPGGLPLWGRGIFQPDRRIPLLLS